MPYFFLKQVEKYFGSLNPTEKASSLILILSLFSVICLQATVRRTSSMKAPGVMPVRDFNFSVSTVREVPIAVTNAERSKSQSEKCALTQSTARDEYLVHFGIFEFSDIENKLPAIVGPLPFHTLEAIHYLGEEQ